MDKERRKELMEIYKNCSDDDLIEMIQEGRESYEDGAFELILKESQKRGLAGESDAHEIYNYEIGEAGLYIDALNEEGLPFEIQIKVDDRDYRRSEIATKNIILPHDDE